MRSFVAGMRSAERIVRNAIMRHQKQDTCRGSNAGERPRGKADQQADID